ncbi:MAG: two-component system response regulator CreB [Propionivibrio sp.]
MTLFADDHANLSMHAAQILLVEDEPAIADTLIYALGKEDFAVRHLLLGREALPAQRATPFDLLILDVGLPDISGFDVLRQLRGDPAGRDLPVIFLTARGEEIDRILGLELGADDYVSKPFSPREVAARARAVLRRQARTRPGIDAGEIAASIWQHRADALRIAYHGVALDLTRYEYQLLALLLSAPGRVFTREQIMARVWADAPDTADRSIDTHVKTLRAKLRAIAPGDEAIVTHRGTGYALATRHQ